MEKEIILEESKNSPGITYYPTNKNLEIFGRSIPEDPETVYSVVTGWLTSYFDTETRLNVKIKLEYVNSGSAKCLLQVLKRLTDYHRSGRQVRIKWICEADDDSMVDLGENFLSMPGIPLEIEKAG